MVYKVKFLNKEYEIITDKAHPGVKFAISLQTSGKKLVIIRIDGERLNFAKYLYGHSVRHLNGNELDYRKKNCVKFSMSDYNLTQRKYKTGSSGIRGVLKLKNGFKFQSKAGGICFTSELYKTAGEAVREREKYLKKLIAS